MNVPKTHARRFLIALVLLAVGLTIVLVRPFWVPFALAAALAAALRRPMEWLTARVRGRRQLAAVVVVLGVLLAVVLPIAGVGAFVVREVLAGAEWFRNLLESEGVAGILHRLPGPLEATVRRVLAAIPDPQAELQRLAGARGGEAAGAVASLLTATGGAVFDAGIMLIALFFFLADGHRAVGWLDEHVPLGPGRFRALVEEFRKTSVSVIWATLATAGIQTAAGVVGYVIARAPNVVFLAIGTFVLALIPALGGTVMIVAVGVLLLATGKMLAGAFLVVWGVGVVSIVDNVARPYLLKGGMELHGGVVFFALLGGLAAFGAIGLVLGPLILTFLLSVLSMYEREYAERPAAGAEEAAERDGHDDARRSGAP
jgi:predicted PurR-regulated permease PerM